MSCDIQKMLGSWNHNDRVPMLRIWTATFK